MLNTFQMSLVCIKKCKQDVYKLPERILGLNFVLISCLLCFSLWHFLNSTYLIEEMSVMVYLVLSADNRLYRVLCQKHEKIFGTSMQCKYTNRAQNSAQTAHLMSELKSYIHL